MDISFDDPFVVRNIIHFIRMSYEWVDSPALETRNFWRIHFVRRNLLGASNPSSRSEQAIACSNMEAGFVEASLNSPVLRIWWFLTGFDCRNAHSHYIHRDWVELTPILRFGSLDRGTAHLSEQYVCVCEIMSAVQQLVTYYYLWLLQYTNNVHNVDVTVSRLPCCNNNDK